MQLNDDLRAYDDQRSKEKGQNILDEANSLRHRCSHQAEQAYLRQQVCERVKHSINTMVTDHPDYVHPEIKDMIQCLCFALLVVVSWFITTVLINQPTAYLIGRSLGDSSVLTAVGTVVFTILLTSTQIAIAILAYQARTDQKGERAWTLASLFMACFTAGMVLATTMALQAAGQTLYAHDIALTGGQMLLGFTFDGLLIISGESLAKALGFGLFTAKYAWGQYRIYRLTVDLNEYLDEVRRLYHSYLQKLADYEQLAGKGKLKHPPFNNTVQWVLKEWVVPANSLNSLSS